MLQPQPSPVSHEAAFLERYQRLYRWSLALTRNNQQQAEDLLHDAFVQFLLSRPDLQSIQNLDGYLHTILKNMRISQLRRSTRLQEATYALAATSLDNILLLPDHISLESGLGSVEQRTQMQMRDELQRICQYAIMRKTSSRVGSVLILRFFLGYYPQEIAQILRSSRAVVDKLLQRARGEARLFLNEPTSLSFIKANASPDVLPAETVAPECSLNEFLQGLREAIYRSQLPACASTKTMRAWYEAKSSTEGPTGPTTQALSHLVSCPRCPDQMNELLGLPLLAARYPMNMTGPDTRKQDKDGKGGKRGGGSSAGSGGGVRETFFERSKRRFKDAFEHRPQELRVCVNGFLLGSQRINAEYNEQALSIKREEKIGFVEVFSEREIRLLFYCVESPPDGPVEHHQVVDLSDGRSLELSLDFSTESPNLELQYHDPTLASDVLTDLELSESESAPSGAESPKKDLGREFASSIKQRALAMWRQFVASNVWARPAPVTAFVALMIIAALLVNRYMQPTSHVPLAADLLQRAAAAENVVASRRDQVLHRTITLEERSVPGAIATGSELIASRKIEIWQSAEKGITARRLYDEKNQLVTGDWRRNDGVQTIYHHSSQKSEVRRQKSEGSGVQNPIRNLDDVWQLDPSANSFSSLIADAPTRVEDRGNVYVIFAESVKSADASAVSTASGSDRVSGPVSTESGSDRVSGSILKATLILNRSDLHPVEQTLVITQGNETREYRFIATAFEQKAPNTVAPAVFEPEPELLSATKPDTRNSKPETNPLAPLAPGPLPLAASASMEVEVLRLLGSISADMGQEVSVKREADGALHVEAVVESEKRKAEILSALSPVAHERAVKLRIETTAEAQARIRRESRRGQTDNGSPVNLEGTATANAIPVDADVRRYLQAKGIADKQLDEEIARLSSRMINRSHQTMLHAFALKNLVERFSEEDLRSLDPATRAKWRSMIAAHAAAFLRDTGSIRQDLTPMFGAAGSASADETVDVTDDASLLRAASRLAQLASVVNEGIQSDFTISTGGRSANVKTAQFWRSLKSAERVATALQR